VRDNDDSIIPSSQEIADVKESILIIKPANTSDDDVFVRAPTEISTSFVFSALSPDTVGIRNSIQINLQALFEGNELGITVTETAYNTAIQNSFDPETNSQVQSFTIDVSGDIVADFNEILTLGLISYT